MEELLEIYKRIEDLRNKGVKMKDIADKTNMPASVLSSLYSSVLPTFARSVKKGMTEEEDAETVILLIRIDRRCVFCYKFTVFLIILL